MQHIPYRMYLEQILAFFFDGNFNEFLKKFRSKIPSTNKFLKFVQNFLKVKFCFSVGQSHLHWTIHVQQIKKKELNEDS